MRLLASDFGSSFVEEIAGLVLFLAFVIYVVPVPQLRRRMNERQAAIGEQLAAGDRAREQAAALLEARKGALETARVEAARLVEQARASAERLRQEGERRAEAEYQRIVAKAAVDIELERGRMRSEVVAELNELVLIGARGVVEAELTGERQHRLIDEAIAAAETEVA
ncbi:MAG TPA: F0F1 ATP synthase subunit B [Acidimicrobiales bacterium]|nr:F0F1 ATP synthase subunit B [Acidimicrobiales bacterium]